MKHSCFAVLGILSAGILAIPSAADETRAIHIMQDDAQVRFDSKIYELKHVSAEEILPFVNSAIMRYNQNSTIRRITTENSKKEALLVSTGRKFFPHVDDIVAALDRPGRTGTSESAIQGTGLARVAYAPRFRAAPDLSNIINSTLGSSAGAAYVNRETNTIYWRDQTTAAKRTLSWVQKLDQPLPQVRIRLNYYELRDSDLKDWGFDYLAWKNGPGVNLLNVGYNSGQLIFDELLEQVPYAFSSTWGLGGFFTAPQFDMSFIRCLQQSGNANIVSTGSLVMINTPVANEQEYAELQNIQDKKPSLAPFIYRVNMEPEYQNIAKNVLGRSFVGKSFYEDEDGEKHADPPALEVQIVNPFICYDVVPGREAEKGSSDGGVLFDYSLYFKGVVERGNTGAELSNNTLVGGSATLAFGKEKLLTIYDKENDVEQTIGLPILCRIPVIKYLFSTVTKIKERTYIVVTAEASMVRPGDPDTFNDDSMATGAHRRIENPFHVHALDD